MADDKISFSCTSCSAVNWTDLPSIKDKVSKQRIILICGSCGRVNEPNKIEKSQKPGKEGQNYLACIPFTGIEKDLPVGYVSAGGRTLWTDANGKSWTTEEFTMKYGIYPPIYWKNKKLEEQAFRNAFQISQEVGGGIRVGSPAIAVFRTK